MNKELLQARIDCRVAELRVLAAKTAYEYWCDQCEQCERPGALALMLKQAMAKRIRSDEHKSQD
jgi:hypothetical protein